MREKLIGSAFPSLHGCATKNGFNKYSVSFFDKNAENLNAAFFFLTASLSTVI